MDWVSACPHLPCEPDVTAAVQAAHVAGQPDGFRDLAQVIVGEMVPVTAEFPGQSPLAEALTTGGCVLENKGRITEQARIWPGAAASLTSSAGRMSTTPGVGGAPA